MFWVVIALTMSSGLSLSCACSPPQPLLNYSFITPTFYKLSTQNFPLEASQWQRQGPGTHSHALQTCKPLPTGSMHFFVTFQSNLSFWYFFLFVNLTHDNVPTVFSIWRLYVSPGVPGICTVDRVDSTGLWSLGHHEQHVTWFSVCQILFISSLCGSCSHSSLLVLLVLQKDFFYPVAELQNSRMAAQRKQSECVWKKASDLMFCNRDIFIYLCVS